MIRRAPSYEAAYLGKFPCYEDDLPVAFRWGAERASRLGCSVTVVAPTRDRFNEGPLGELPASIGKETSRTLRQVSKRVQPVVVSCWPTSEDLDHLDGRPSVEALIVVPWDEDEISTWRRARGAVDVLGRQPAPTAPTISDPVVGAALRDLTLAVNLSTGLSHPDDRADAIETFRVLKKNKLQFVPDEIKSWAMVNGWSAEDARQLAEYAAGVLAGKAYRTNRQRFRPDVVVRWREQAAGKS